MGTSVSSWVVDVAEVALVVVGGLIVRAGSWRHSKLPLGLLADLETSTGIR